MPKISIKSNSKVILFISIPIIFIVLLIAVLYQSMAIDPREKFFSTPMNKPVPDVRLASLYQWNVFRNTLDLQPVKSPIGNWYLMNIWGSWCERCQLEHPFLMDLAHQGIILYSMDYRDTIKAGQEFLSTYGNPYQFVFWDGRGVGMFRWGVNSVPQTFLVDPRGYIRYQQAGMMTKDVWENKMLPIIKRDNALTNVALHQ